MRSARLVPMIVAAWALLSAPGPLAATEEGIQRFALVAGSNVGGKATADLKYAANDAKRVRDLLVRIGGTREENLMLLTNPGRENLANGFAFLGAKIRKAKAAAGQSQFVFYYSGHSDERGLLLFGEYFTYRELRDALAAVGADVRIVVLDSCSSGAFTRLKGGAIGSPFLLDDSSSVEGHAYITSSTAEESSQESDKIESSFFTHYFLVGLRGAADSDGDGKVSLNEAYDYAYARTLAETERTRSGAQHPAFDLKLNGMGNLVLTDLREGDAVLVLPKGLSGKLSLRDVSNKLVLEVAKGAGREMRVGVEQGYYRILLEEDRILSETVLIVDERKEYEVRRDLFHGIKAAAHQPRGTDPSPFVLIPLGLRYEASEGSSFYINALGGKADRVEGPMLSLLYNQTELNSSGYQGSVFANIASGYSGMQGSLGANVALGDFLGFQAALLLNETGGDLRGLQLALVNHAGGNVKLGQVGAVNVAAGEGGYFQAGGFNRSISSIEGGQAGLVNVGKTVKGLQFGLFNYSEYQTGVQVGLVNISRRLEGLPIGILDIQLNGENHIDLILESPAPRFAGMAGSYYTTTYFRFGSRYFYKYLDVGLLGGNGGSSAGYSAFFAGGGLGFRIPALFEGFAYHIDGGVNYHSLSYRLKLVEDPKYYTKIIPQFRVFASCKVLGNAGLVAGFEQWVYTKYFHSMPEDAAGPTIETGYGLLVVNSKFFVGIQL